MPIPTEEPVKVKKKPINAKQKGSEFERLICRNFTKWVTGQPKPEIFWRSTTSGAAATVARKNKQKTNHGSGDIVALAPAGEFFSRLFSLEAKHYNNFQFSELLSNKKDGLNCWWKQCCHDAECSGKMPFLVFRKNFSPIYVGIDKEGHKVLAECYGDLPEAHFYSNLQNMYVFLLEDFFNLYDSTALVVYKK